MTEHSLTLFFVQLHDIALRETFVNQNEVKKRLLFDSPKFSNARTCHYALLSICLPILV